MKLITIEQARDHVKADGDDDELLAVYCNAAEASCERLANRKLFATAADYAAAVAAVPAAMIAAYTAYDTAASTANAQDDDRVKNMMLAQAQYKLDAATNDADATLHGLVVEAELNGDDIIGAVLLTTGHFYRNRESVVTGQGAAAVEVPLTTRHIMEEYRWIGTEFVQ